MKYTIIGSGAAGGMTGEILFASGKKTEFVDSDREHIAAIIDRELEIRKVNGPVRMPVKAFTPDNFTIEKNSIECAVICVRPENMKDAVSFILPRLSREGLVINLCWNGDPRTFGIPERQLIQGVGIMDGDYLEPGLIHCGYPGKVYLAKGGQKEI